LIRSKDFGFRLVTAALFALLLALTGCATQTPPSNETVSLNELVRQGRFALRAEEPNQASEAVQGSFVWRDVGGRLTLDLNNPFGSTLARVLVEPGQATMTQSNGETMRSSDPDELVQQVIGRRVPVRDMRAWMRTPLRQAPAMEQVKRDEQGRIVAFAQHGWKVELGRFDALGPRLLVLSRLEGSKQVVIRLVVDAP
jgi:outer membrane lipoprotein LolB